MYSHLYTVNNPFTLTFYYNNIVAISVCICVERSVQRKATYQTSKQADSGNDVTCNRLLYFSRSVLKVYCSERNLTTAIIPAPPKYYSHGC